MNASIPSGSNLHEKRDKTWWEAVDTDFLGLTYFPFFSNCRGFDSHIYTSKLFEDYPKPDCKLVPQSDVQFVAPYPWENDNNGWNVNSDKCQMPEGKPEVRDVSEAWGMRKYFPEWDMKIVEDEDLGEVNKVPLNLLEKDEYVQSEWPGTYLSCQ